MIPVFLPVLPMVRAVDPPKAAESVKVIPMRTWFDMKQGVTHVETSASLSLVLKSTILSDEMPPLLKAGFITRGYKTEPPDIVTLSIKMDKKSKKTEEIILHADGRRLGIFNSHVLNTPTESEIWITRQFELRRNIYEQWVNAKFPVLEFASGEGSVITAEDLVSLRELARRMVARRPLTFYFGRESLTATTLNDGRVLAAGGYDGFRALKNCEIYDPTSGRFATGLKMQFPRRNHTATMLKDGKVLVVGGGIDGGDTALDSAELFDPATNRFSPAGKMRDARMSHTATLLNDGRVLIVGGGSKAPLASAEIYDPATNLFQPTGNLIRRRLGHTATLLNDGDVLIAGGVDGDILDSTETYNPISGKFSIGDAMSAPRWEHAATLLNDGTVLIEGGRSGLGQLQYDRFSEKGRILETRASDFLRARWGHVAVKLHDGKLLIAGGYGDYFNLPRSEYASPHDFRDSLLAMRIVGSDVATVQQFEENGTQMISANQLLTPRRHFAAATLRDGRVLLIGGLNDDNPALNTAEFYDPKTDEMVPWRDVVNGEK